jgi:hypothetical protein
VQFLSLRLDPFARPVSAWVRERVARFRTGTLSPAISADDGHHHHHDHVH